MKNIILAAVATAALTAGFAPQAQAATYQATCQFNNQAPMGCVVTSGTDYHQAIRWADGVTEVYSGDGNGNFRDARGGIWATTWNEHQGTVRMEHANGNVIRYQLH